MVQEKLIKFAKCILLLLVVAEAQKVPENPCPKIFTYEKFGDEWIGKIRLDDVRLGHSVNLYVKFSAADLPANSGKGHLDLFEDLQQSVQTVFQRKPLLYKLSFPVQDPLPTIVEIAINKKVVCIGDPDNSSQSMQIELHHTFYSRVKSKDVVDNSIGILTPYAHRNKVKRDITERSQNNISTLQTSEDLPALEKTSRIASTTPLITISTPTTTTTPPTTTLATTTSTTTKATTINEICGILHEEERQRGYWPWLVAIFLFDDEDRLHFQCNGVLIKADISLTAANCFYREGQTEPIPTKDIATFTGRYDLYNKEDSEFLITLRVKMLQGFYTSNSFEFDFAILQHLHPADFAKYPHVRPICTWTGLKNPALLEGRKGKVVGWGRDSETQAVSSLPKEVDVDIVPRKTCLQYNRKLEDITERTNFCGSDKNVTGVCMGDSGSGLFLYNNNTDRWELRGILAGTLKEGVIKTNGLCQLDEFTVYTDIPQLRLRCPTCFNHIISIY